MASRATARIARDDLVGPSATSPSSEIFASHAS
jgi:hypothetical protein